MKIKSQRDFFSGLLLIFVGAAFAIGATNYNFGAAVRPGPGYFPFGLGIILTALGVIVFITSFNRRCTDGDPIGAIPWRPLIFVVGAILFFAVSLPRLGFVITFPLMIVLTSFATTEFTWKGALMSALVLTVASYLIFIVGLQLNIPVWPV